MNKSVKFSIASVFVILLVFSCANHKKNIPIVKNVEKVEYTEVRRLNAEVDLKEYTIINSTKGIKDLYRQLDNSKYSRSAPIPVLDESNAYFLVLKPKLKDKKYGDIEIQQLEMNGSVLRVNYKEIDNFEYEEQKQSNPIVILKVLHAPGEIKLNLIN